MSGKFQQITQDINTNLEPLRKELPDVMSAFGQLAQSATKNGALDKKTKELIALGLAVGSHCEGCIGFHTKALARLGATTEEVNETLGMAIYMGGGPSLMYASSAIESFKEFKNNQ